MPLTVITLVNVPPSLKGDLTKWMQEIATGVYVGNFNSKIREKLWERVKDSLKSGQATLSYAANNEIGYNFETINCDRIPMDFEGIPLIFIPKESKVEEKEEAVFKSKQRIFHEARKFQIRKDIRYTRDYIVLDLETTGVDAKMDRVIEIGAIKIQDSAMREYHKLIKIDFRVPEAISKLTGLKDEDLSNFGIDFSIQADEFLEFIEDLPILGYNIDFDIKFLNEELARLGKRKITNNTFDVMKFVKRENMFLRSYKLENVLKEYNIADKLPHRALLDARLTFELLNKVKKIFDFIN